jgi:hypothetical protein
LLLVKQIVKVHLHFGRLVIIFVLFRSTECDSEFSIDNVQVELDACTLLSLGVKSISTHVIFFGVIVREVIHVLLFLRLSSYILLGLDVHESHLLFQVDLPVKFDFSGSPALVVDSKVPEQVFEMVRSAILGHHKFHNGSEFFLVRLLIETRILVEGHGSRILFCFLIQPSKKFLVFGLELSLFNVDATFIHLLAFTEVVHVLPKSFFCSVVSQGFFSFASA